MVKHNLVVILKGPNPRMVEIGGSTLMTLTCKGLMVYFEFYQHPME